MIYFDKLTEFLKLKNIDFECDVSMKKYTSFKIGGKAVLMCFVKCEDELKNLLSFCNDNGIKTMVIGNGSNLLVNDDGIDYPIIKLTGDFEKIVLKDGKVIAGAAVTLNSLCRFALNNKLSGLEFAYGIPGTVGGGVYMNAGAYGGQMSDVVETVNHLNGNGVSGCFEKDELDFDYRHSAYSNSDKVVTFATFALTNGNADEISNKMEDYFSRRKDKQPLNFPSAGSVFKRPQGYFAGALIEQSGLKGKSIGGAQVSEKHAGFIVNTGKATCEDVLSLVKLCQNTVMEKFGVLLECEIKKV